MNTELYLLPTEIVWRLGWTLLHFLWQGAAIAALAGLVLAILRNKSASARYIVAGIGLVTMLSAAAITSTLISSPPAESTLAAKADPPIRTATVRERSTPTEDMPLPDGPDPQAIAPLTSQKQVLTLTTIHVKNVIPWHQRMTTWCEPHLPWIVTAWLIGSLALSLRLFGGWIQVQRLRHRWVEPVEKRCEAVLNELRQKLRISRPVQLLASQIAHVPMAMGWIRPVILLPITAVTGLSTDQLRALLAHELAHIRRYDYLVNILQSVIEVLLFYHPAVWWLSRRIRTEREHCCDDIAVACCGDSLLYARTLATLEELRIAPNLAAAATGGQLAARIRRLFDRTRAHDRIAGSLTTGIVTLSMLCVFAAAILSTHTLAEADNKPAVSQPATFNNKPDSIAWHVLSTPNVGPLLLGLAPNLGKAITSSRRHEPIWIGADEDGTIELEINSETDEPGEIFVGFFKEPNWSSEPVQVRSFPGPGKYRINKLPISKLHIGAIIGTPPKISAVGVHASWPEPIEITPAGVPVHILLSKDLYEHASDTKRFQGSPNRYFGKSDSVLPSTFLKGRTLGPNGEVVPFSLIRLLPRQTGSDEELLIGSNDDGIYYYGDEISSPYHLSASRYDLMPTGLGYRAQYLSRNHVLSGPQTVDFRFPDWPSGMGSIAGQVVDQNRQPVREFFVRANRESLIDQRQELIDDEMTHSFACQLAINSNDGEFELKGLPEGIYFIQIVPFDVSAYESHQGTTQRLKAGRMPDIRLELQSKVVLYAHILFEDGTPVYSDPPPWRNAKVTVSYREKGRERGWLVGDVKPDGAVSVRLDRAEVAALKAGNATLDIHYPSAKLGYPKVGTLTFEQLATYPTLAVSVKLPRPKEEQKQDSKSSDSRPASLDSAQNVRVIFDPNADPSSTSQSGWSPLFSPKHAPDEYMASARVRIGDSFPVAKESDQKTLFRVKLLEGNDDALNVEVSHGDIQEQLTLVRDNSVNIEVDGQIYWLLFPTQEVVSTQPVSRNAAPIYIGYRPADQKKDTSTQPAGSALDSEPNTRITVMFGITKGSAATVAATINVLYAESKTGSHPGDSPPPTAVAEPTKNVVYVMGTKSQIEQIKTDVIEPFEMYQIPPDAKKVEEAAKTLQKLLEDRNRLPDRAIKIIPSATRPAAEPQTMPAELSAYRQREKQLKDELQTLLDKKQSFIANELGATPGVTTGVNIVGETLRSLAAEVTRLEQEKLQAKAAYDNLVGVDPSQIVISPEMMAMIKTDPQIMGLEAQKSSLEQQRQIAIKKDGANHRSVQTITAQIEVIEKQLQELMEKKEKDVRDFQINSAQTMFLNAMQAEMALRDRMLEQEARQRDLDQGMAKYRALEDKQQQLTQELNALRVSPLRPIQPGDRLSIRAVDFLKQDVESNLTQTVDEHGNIYLPKIGKIAVQGLSTSALRDTIIRVATEQGIYLPDANPSVFVDFVETKPHENLQNSPPAATTQPVLPTATQPSSSLPTNSTLPPRSPPASETDPNPATQSTRDRIIGDIELLRLVYTAHKENRERIQTWRGTASVEERIHHTADPNPADEGGVSAGEILFVLDRSANALLWNRIDTQMISLNGDASGDLPLGFSNNLTRQDGTYQYRNGGGPDRTQLFIGPPIDRRVDKDPFNFDPEKYLISPDLSDIVPMEQRLATYFAPNEMPTSTGRTTHTIKREGNIVRLDVVKERPSGLFQQEWQFDLDQGGSLIASRTMVPMIQAEVTASYQQLQNIWIPKKIHLRLTTNKAAGNPGSTHQRSIVFKQSVLNKAIDPAEFSPDKLGVKLGDMVWDRRQSKSVLPYQYAGFILTPGDPRQGIYYIQGKVRRPGVYSIAGRTITLRQAIAAAGGITAPSSGDKLKCAITHHHSNGKEETIRFDDIQALLSSPGPNLDIQPEDVIDFQ